MLVRKLIALFRKLKTPAPKPELDVKAYWGAGDGQSYKEDVRVRPFRVEFGATVIEKLRGQLSDESHLQEPLESVNFEYGFNSRHLKTVVQYWRDDYLSRWTERQTHLNKYPQFLTQIQGLDIHFIHVKSQSNGVGNKHYPVLLLHGWPGSVVEFYSFIEKANTLPDISFDFVVPSLVGYGFSEVRNLHAESDWNKTVHFIIWFLF